MNFPHRLAAAAAVLLLTPAMATAQARLPVDVGVYAEAGKPCSSGWIWVNTGTRAGYLSFFGPNQSMGPNLTGVEAIQSTEPGRDGFTMMNGGPLEVRRSGTDGVTVRAWSRANGEVGRNEFRRCAVSALHPRMQAALPQVGFSQAPRPGPGGVTASPAWRVTRVAGVPSASVTAAAGLPQLAVRCRADVAYLHLKTSAAERGRGPRRIEFVGGTTGLRRTETFQRDPETGDWSTGAGSETLALLGGRDTRVELREDGMSIGTLSLVGSTAALGQALAGCPTQGVTGGLAAAPTGGARTAAPLEILPGHYVTEDRACGNPFEIFYFDGRRYGYYAGGDGRRDVTTLARADRSRDGWSLRDGTPAPETFIKVLAPNRIQMISGPPMRWCPDAQLPRDRRVAS
jgi:hypothetical protein